MAIKNNLNPYVMKYKQVLIQFTSKSMVTLNFIKPTEIKIMYINQLFRVDLISLGIVQ